MYYGLKFKEGSDNTLAIPFVETSYSEVYMAIERLNEFCGVISDSFYDITSIMESVVLSEADEEKVKESFKKRFTDTVKLILEKIKEIFKKFVNAIKTAYNTLSEKLLNWYEEHNLSKGVLKVLMHGLTFDDIEAHNKKYQGQPDFQISGCKVKNNADYVFLLNKDIRDAVEEIFDKEFKSLESLEEKIESAGTLAEAKEAYNNIISECKDKENDIKNALKKRHLIGSNSNEKIKSDYIKKKNENKDKIVSAFSDIFEGVFGPRMDTFDYYFEITDKPIDKYEFDWFVKYLEDTRNRSKTLKQDANQWEIISCKRKIDRLEKEIKDINKNADRELTSVIKHSETMGNTFGLYQKNEYSLELSNDFTQRQLLSINAKIAIENLRLKMFIYINKQTMATNFKVTTLAYAYLTCIRIFLMKFTEKIVDKKLEKNKNEQS